ncbi:hypothetical protein B0H13DRAFT_1886334 [Mycena leptocephala]|nr:hypothetical protein B0H13DRAFT_1886334 [Mycena leptocephala]
MEIYGIEYPPVVEKAIILSAFMSIKRSRATMHKHAARKPPHDFQTYVPGVCEEEKARSHRKVQAAYRARNPQIREKQQVQAAERRAALKANRRRWDPPKRPKAIPLAQEEGPAPCTEDQQVRAAVSDILSFQDHRAPDWLSFPGSELEDSERPEVGTTGSPTPDERIACTALAELAQGPALDAQFDAEESPTAYNKKTTSIRSKDSVLERAMQLSSTVASGVRFPPQFFLDDGPLVLASQTGKLPAGVTPLSRVQELKLHYTGNVGPLTPVQSAQILVAQTNAGTLTRPTLAEQMAWRVRPTISWDLRSSEASYISYSQGCAMNAWRLQVCKAVRQAYLAGEELLTNERTLSM